MKTTILHRPRDVRFVIGSFLASDNTCPHCQAGYQTSCQHREFALGAQAPSCAFHSPMEPSPPHPNYRRRTSFRFLPDLIDLVWKRKANPGKVFDLVLPLEQVAEGYRAMDERRAIKALLRP